MVQRVSGECEASEKQPRIDPIHSHFFFRFVFGKKKLGLLGRVGGRRDTQTLHGLFILFPVHLEHRLFQIRAVARRASINAFCEPDDFNSSVCLEVGRYRWDYEFVLPTFNEQIHTSFDDAQSPICVRWLLQVGGERMKFSSARLLTSDRMQILTVGMTKNAEILRAEALIAVVVPERLVRPIVVPRLDANEPQTPLTFTKTLNSSCGK